MGDEMDLNIRLVLGPEDERIAQSLDDVVITANLSDTLSWAVRLLNDSVTFSYKDRR